MQLETLSRTHSNTKSRRVGRGGRRGKTSGRGMKGQKSRAGHSMRPELRDIIKKIPKLRGHGKNRARTVVSGMRGNKPAVINLKTLETHFETGGVVSPQTLVAKKLIGSKEKRTRNIKILGTGTISKQISVSGCMVSDTARNAITKAGGTIL